MTTIFAMKSSILGTLVDRAVSMPYNSPTDVRAGYRYSGATQLDAIEDEINDAADALLDAMQEPDAQSSFSRAALLIDRSGPWWAGVLTDFFELSPADRSWILARLVPTAATAARALQAAAVEESWSWILSQQSIYTPRWGRYPSVTRPDLVAGRSGMDTLIIDLKVTTRRDLRRAICAYPTDDLNEGLVERFAGWSAHHRHAGFTPESHWALVVGATTSHARARHAWYQMDDALEAHRQSG